MKNAQGLQKSSLTVLRGNLIIIRDNNYEYGAITLGNDLLL